MATGKTEKAKELWNIWDIRVLILLSLFIQVFLTFLAPLRKRSASSILKLVLWILYLSASGIALYIISQISGNPNDSIHKIDLLAFWAPFLLLHLGGPDTITALALEDNELWHRHALELVTQVGVTLYVFSNSVHRRRSQLWVPTVLMFVDGCIKYFERTRALYFASSDTFRGSFETDPVPGLSYARMMDAYYSSITAGIPAKFRDRDDYNTFIDSKTDGKDNQIPSEDKDYSSIKINCTASEADNNDIEDKDIMVLQAYLFFNKFKSIIADSLLDLRVLEESRDCFLRMKGAEALRIIAIELNLMYDVFYTKAFLLHSKQAYLRVISYIAVIASLVLFSRLDKSNYNEVDVVITYILLSGAIALDLCAGVMFVFSDWYIIINYRDFRFEGWQSYISAMLLKLMRRMGWRSGGSRWSRSISKYNLLRCCLKDPPSLFQYLRLRRIKDGLIGMLYVTSDNTNMSDIVNYIVEVFKEKALKSRKGFKGDVCSARGNLLWEDDYYFISDYLKPWTTDVDYDESLLTWHLATDICYHTSSKNGSMHQVISKQLSDYMAYLILKQKVLVSTLVSLSEKRFQDTCAEARKFMRGNNQRLDSWDTTLWAKVKDLTYKIVHFERQDSHDPSFQEESEIFHARFCAQLLIVNTDIPPIIAKGDSSRSVLFEACRLAKQLKMLGEEKQWEIISKVWLELVSYAAVRCSARSHVSQLNKGGELLTFVWLIMAHFGFGKCFSQVSSNSHTKLVVLR